MADRTGRAALAWALARGGPDGALRDGGYFNAATIADPIMSQRPVVATVFAVSSLLGRVSAWDDGELPGRLVTRPEKLGP